MVKSLEIFTTLDINKNIYSKWLNHKKYCETLEMVTSYSKLENIHNTWNH
jgi:hypothetical protein